MLVYNILAIYFNKVSVSADLSIVRWAQLHHEATKGSSGVRMLPQFSDKAIRRDIGNYSLCDAYAKVLKWKDGSVKGVKVPRLC